MRRNHWILGAVLTLAYLAVLVRTAWVTDDAFVTLRTVDHCIQGYGLRWNIDERVQAYTHPLWALLLVPACGLTREFYLTTITLSILCSTLAFVLVVVRLARTHLVTVLAGSVLVLAPAFVSYSTSGLENPLAFLLLALFTIGFLQKKPSRARSFGLGLVGGLLVLTRFDLVLLILPALVRDLYQSRTFTNARRMALGFLPVVIWFGFSLVYYGDLLPNSAHAKLGTGLARSAYVERGFWYLQDALQRETLLAVVVAVVLLLCSRSSRPAIRVLGLGILADLVYVVLVGGDFMRGRFLTVPFFLAVCLLAQTNGFGSGPRVLWIAMALVGILGWRAPTPTFRSGSDFGTDPRASRRIHGISDERAYYFQELGLWNGKPLRQKPGHDLDTLRVLQSRDLGRIRLVFAAGVDGLVAGPRAHVVDTWALGDALLARLPAQGRWRIGHFTRVPPSGYLVTLATGENRIRDPNIQRYYENMRPITRGPLWTRKRWSAIWDRLRKRHQDLIQSTDYEAMGPKDYWEMTQAGAQSAGPEILRRAAHHVFETGDLENAASLMTRLHEMPSSEAQDFAREIQKLLAKNPAVVQ